MVRHRNKFRVKTEWTRCAAIPECRFTSAEGLCLYTIHKNSDSRPYGLVAWFFLWVCRELNPCHNGRGPGFNSQWGPFSAVFYSYKPATTRATDVQHEGRSREHHFSCAIPELKLRDYMYKTELFLSSNMKADSFMAIGTNESGS